MKSLCDEIRLRREIRTDLISSALADFIERYDFYGMINAEDVISMAENKLADMSTEFAIQILKLTDGIKGHRKGERKMINDVICHYDNLIDEGQDPVNDPPKLQAYMSKWDGETFIKLLELNKAKNALEIGCGTGRLAVSVAPNVRFFCGIDISPKTIEIAKSHLKEFNVELICDDFLVYSFAEQFDLIYSSLTFMHIKNKYEAIEKIYRCLAKNGICVLSLDKNQNSILEYGTRQVKVYPDDPEEIMNIFLKCGFCEIERYEIDHAYLIRAKRK